MYIDDAVQAFYEIGLKCKTNTNYYIGNKSPRQLKNFIIEMRNVVNKDLDLGFGDVLFNGISLSYKEFNTSILYDELEFKTMVSFKEGIERTVRWLKLGL
jgi:nucleoside-diphosphate-sugar epimerase